MPKLRAWFIRLTGLVRRGNRERDLANEIETHLQLHIEDNIRSGMTHQEARRKALLRFGGLDSTKEAVRDRRGIPFLETLARDVSYAVRMLRQNKGWTAVAVLSLALGIGVNTALFSIANALLLQKLAVPHPDELVAFRWAGQNDLAANVFSYGSTPPDPVTLLDDPRHTGAALSWEIFQQFRKQSEGLASVVAFIPIFTLNVTANGQAEFARGQWVSGEFYTTLGVSALRGRMIQPADDSESADPVAVISHQYWKQRFAMDGSVIGTKINLNNFPFTIVGITPENLGSTTRVDERAPDVSMPLAFEPVLAKAAGNATSLKQPANWRLLLMARLQPGATRRQIQAKLEAVFEPTIREEWPRALAAMNPERRALPAIAQASHVPRLQIVPGSKGVLAVSPIESGPLKILGVIAGIVLLIVCTNLANLLLSRAAARQREMAVRTAIGATRSRLIGQMMTESVVIASVGGLFGLLAAYWCRTILPEWLGFEPVSIDWNVLSFTAAITFGTSILFGLIPALRMSRVEIAPGIRESSGLAGGRTRTGKCLLVVQVALSLVLLIGAGLFLRTLNNLRHVDFGFNPSNLVLFRILPVLNRYDAGQTSALYERILERLVAIPGVKGATMSSLPLMSNMANTAGFSVDGGRPTGESHALEVHHGYFETMGIPLKLGRTFTAQDNLAGPPVIVINDAFARQFFPNQNPIGHHIQQTFRGAPLVEIVGVVSDAKYVAIRKSAPPTFYIHDDQRPNGVKTFAVRTAGDAAALIPTIRETMRIVDPLLPLQSVSTQGENIEQSIATERVFALTTSLFSSLALVISMIGLFGLMSYAVARRTREIGIRMAIGAERGQVLRSVLGETLVLFAAGIAIGLGIALGSTRLIATRLYGLAPHDVPTVVVAIVLMLAAAALAAYLPARRAAQVDPLTALRYE